MKTDPFRIALVLQIGATLCAMPAFVLAPPVRGRMLLVPVVPGGATRLAAEAVMRGARLVAPGPVAGSLVIDGERSRIAAGMLAHGVLTVDADALDCGDPRTRSR